MKFGAVRPREAEGAIAVHSIRKDGFTLKKGTLIGRSEVAALEAAKVGEIVVARLEPGDVSEDTAAEKPDQGEVQAVGKGKKTDDGKILPLDVKVGDRVLFGKYSGQTVKVEGEELLVMREEDIMGVVEA